MAWDSACADATVSASRRLRGGEKKDIVQFLFFHVCLRNFYLHRCSFFGFICLRSACRTEGVSATYLQKEIAFFGAFEGFDARGSFVDADLKCALSATRAGGASREEARLLLCGFFFC